MTPDDARHMSESKITGKLIASDDPAGVLRFVADMPKARRRKPRAAKLIEAPPVEPASGVTTVERVELLVRASDAAQRELPRRVRVGSSGRVMTQAELLSKLLDAEEIRAEVVSGVRPKVKRCACGSMFEPRLRGPRTDKCRSCRGLVCRCGSDKDSDMICCRECRSSPEYVAARRAQRSAAVRKAIDATTPEQRAERMRKVQAALTPEQLSERSRKAQAAFAPEQRSERMRKAHAAMTPEQRAAKARKISATRRAKASKAPK